MYVCFQGMEHSVVVVAAAPPCCFTDERCSCDNCEDEVCVRESTVKLNIYIYIHTYICTHTYYIYLSVSKYFRSNEARASRNSRTASTAPL